MTQTVLVRKVGSCNVIGVPLRLLAELGWRKGDFVVLTVKGGKLTVTKDES